MFFISGVVDGSMVGRKPGGYKRGRKLMVADVTASILVSPHFKQVPR